MKKWTQKEIKILKEKFPSHYIKELIIELNRTKDSISHKAQRLGIRKDPIKFNKCKKYSPRFYCDYCGNYFRRKPSQINRAKKRYCSIKCKNVGAIKYNNKANCVYCGAQIDRKPSKINPKINNFCNISCKAKWQEIHLKLDGNPVWRGGISFEPYTPAFNKILKEKIKKRGGYICQICYKFSYKLDVHHIDYNKSNNNPINLICLCPSCHAKTNYNRRYWINRLNAKLCVLKQQKETRPYNLYA